jgi:hypothetical protein
VLLDARRQVVRGGQDGRDVHAVRIGSGPGIGLFPVRADALSAPAEQGGRAAGVAAAGVGQPDRDLGQALPHVALTRPGRFPGRLEDLVRVERASVAKQLIGERRRLGPGDYQVVGDPGLAGLGAAPFRCHGTGQRASQFVAGARVPWPAGRIAVPRQRSGSGSASQPSSSVFSTSGRSSCGKWPAPSITRQR